MRRLLAAFLLCLAAGVSCEIPSVLPRLPACAFPWPSVPAARAQDLPWDTIFAQTDAVNPDGLEQALAFEEAGPWLSVTATQHGMIAPRIMGTQKYGLVFAMEDGSRVTWDQVFSDGDAAAAWIEAQAEAEAASLGNAYSEYNDISPVPRDNFTVGEHVFTVYYPAAQLSYFSGLSGGFSFYAYELDGLLAEGVPIAQGEISEAETAVRQAVDTGALPGALADWAMGMQMQEADEALGLVDVPDFDAANALWRFEAPLMQGVTFLSDREDMQVETAVITGIVTTHYDLSGLQTGRTTFAACEAALQGLSPETEPQSMRFIGGTYALTLRFEEDILYSIALTTVD